MALQPAIRQRVGGHELVRALTAAAIVVVLMAALYAITGGQGTGVPLEIVPDPAGVGIPF